MAKENVKDLKETTGKSDQREKSHPLTEVGHHIILFIGLLGLGILSNYFTNNKKLSHQPIRFEH